MRKLPTSIVIAGILALPLSVNAKYTIQGTVKPTTGENSGSIIANAESLDQTIGAVQDLHSRTTAVEERVDTVQREIGTIKSTATQAAADATEAKKLASGLNDKVEKNEKNIGELDTKVKNAQERADSAYILADGNKTEIGRLVNTTSNHEGRITNLEGSIGKGAQAYEIAVENKAAIKQEVKDRIEGDKETLAASKAYTDSKYGQLSEAIEKNRKESFAGIAAALAASQIPQVTQGSYFSLGAGLGSYQGQNAVAVGMSARLGDNIVSRLTVTGDTQQRTGMGAGFAVEW